MVGVLEKMHTSGPSDALAPSRSLSGFSMGSDDNEGSMPISWEGSMANLGAGMAWPTAGKTAGMAAGNNGPSRGEGSAQESSSGRPSVDGASSAAVGGTGKVITVSSGQALKFIKVYGELIRCESASMVISLPYPSIPFVTAVSLTLAPSRSAGPSRPAAM